VEGTAAVLIRTEDPETVSGAAGLMILIEEKKARTSTPCKTKREMAECHLSDASRSHPKSKLKRPRPATMTLPVGK